MVQKMISTRYQVVFYAENAYYFQYFCHLFTNLQERKIKICYITSDANDPVFALRNENTDVVFSKSTLAFAFSRIQAEVVIMTMPDLDRFIIKKSKQVKKYIYVFHAMVSTHQQYRSHAFDHYDAILMAGPHHQRELREAEEMYKLPSRDLIPYGYPLLDDLSERLFAVQRMEGQVLIAPSWYEEGILQTCIHEIVEGLSQTSHKVFIRPHPEFIKRNKTSFKKLLAKTREHSGIQIDTNPSLWNSLLSSDWLVTDRSGIAFEFAFVKKRPVVFIDTPPKIQNPEVDRFSNQPVENLFRDQLGFRLPPSSASEVGTAIHQLAFSMEKYSDSIEQVRKEVLYPSSNNNNAVDYILKQLE